MGDVRVCMPRRNGLLLEEGSLPSPSQPSNPHPMAINPESWRLAEGTTQRIIWRIQPTRVADQRRRDVIEYVRNLIRRVAEVEIFPFGSVPLKTYLPDGDIDLTAIGMLRIEDALASEVRAVLEGEEQNRNAEFEVKDVQYIHAEVILVKCLVQNIVVDISFQQVGGLCTLCFLEKVDHMIGKNHLFKRSIILIKAWCYYESRILGAHHGLISTYALEILVLYIFQFFHTSLSGPLMVLYRFLDYFSKFDWDNYHVSLNGPVCISSCPEIVTEPPDTDGGDLLLSSEFLKSCANAYVSAFKGSDNNPNTKPFVKKHLNIVDPLRANNNLGRSVSKGNFYRIRSAFSYGARKLGRILILPGERIADELKMFFMNTLDRHGSGERPDVQDTDSGFPGNKLSDLNGADSLSPRFCFERDIEDGIGTPLGPLSFSLHGGLFEDISTLMGVEWGRQPFDIHLSRNHLNRCIEAESDGSAGGNFISGIAEDTTHALSSRDTSETCKKLPASGEVRHLLTGTARHAPHLFFCQDNGKIESEEPEQRKGIVSEISMERASTTSSDDTPSAECSGSDMAGNPEAYGLSDLTGDYSRHLRNFLYASQCLDQPPYSRFHNKQAWNTLHQLNMFHHVNANGMIPSCPYPPAPVYYPFSTPFILGGYGLEDLRRTRGTGTYFPISNLHSYKERQSPGRGRNLAPVGQMPRPQNNGWALILPEKNWVDKGSAGPPSHARHLHFGGVSHGSPGQLESPQSSSIIFKEQGQAGDPTFSPEGRLEFGSLGPVKVSNSPPEPSRKLDPNGPLNWAKATASSSAVQKVGTSITNERSRQAYRLKDEDEFPPLTGVAQCYREKQV